MRIYMWKTGLGTLESHLRMPIELLNLDLPRKYVLILY